MPVKINQKIRSFEVVDVAEEKARAEAAAAASEKKTN